MNVFIGGLHETEQFALLLCNEQDETRSATSNLSSFSVAHKAAQFADLSPNSGATDIVFVTLFRTAVGTVTAWHTSCCAMAKRTQP